MRADERGGVGMIGAFVSDALMTAVITRLTGDATFVALNAGGVFDAVPQPLPAGMYTWVTVREDPRPQSTFSRLGAEAIVSLQWFCPTRVYDGTKLIDQAASRASALFHEQAITLNGWIANYVNTEDFRSLGDLEDPDGQVVRTKLMTIRFLVEKS
jgi:hypothetical protein